MKNIYKIDLSQILDSLSDQSYSVIKLSEEYPNYSVGSDIDILCLNKHKCTEIILKELNKYVSKDFYLKVQKYDTQTHIDVIHKRDIHFRFDLYHSIPLYKNILLKNDYFSTIIENSRIENINGQLIKLPSVLDEIILRYIEFIEYFSGRPDKIKHLEFVLQKMDIENIDKNKFLDRLHYYLVVPNTYNYSQHSKSYLRKRMARIKKKLKKIKYIYQEKKLIGLIKFLKNYIKK